MSLVIAGICNVTEPGRAGGGWLQLRVTMSIDEEGSDAQRLDELTSLLHAELRDLDLTVKNVSA